MFNIERAPGYLDPRRVQHLDEVYSGDAHGLWATGVDHVEERTCLSWLYKCMPQRSHAPTHLAENHLLMSGLSFVAHLILACDVNQIEILITFVRGGRYLKR